jgi:hypothetical protein
MASIALYLVLSLGLGLVALQANNAASKAGSTAHTAFVACEANNDFRAADLEKWQYIIDLSEAVPRTPAEERDLQEFIRFIMEADKLSDCVVA